MQQAEIDIDDTLPGRGVAIGEASGRDKPRRLSARFIGRRGGRERATEMQRRGVTTLVDLRKRLNVDTW